MPAGGVRHRRHALHPAVPDHERHVPPDARAGAVPEAVGEEEELARGRDPVVRESRWTVSASSASLPHAGTARQEWSGLSRPSWPACLVSSRLGLGCGAVRGRGGVKMVSDHAAREGGGEGGEFLGRGAALEGQGEALVVVGVFPGARRWWRCRSRRRRGGSKTPRDQSGWRRLTLPSAGGGEAGGRIQPRIEPEDTIACRRRGRCTGNAQRPSRRQELHIHRPYNPRDLAARTASAGAAVACVTDAAGAHPGMLGGAG